MSRQARGWEKYLPHVYLIKEDTSKIHKHLKLSNKKMDDTACAIAQCAPVPTTSCKPFLAPGHEWSWPGGLRAGRAGPGAARAASAPPGAAGGTAPAPPGQSRSGTDAPLEGPQGRCWSGQGRPCTTWKPPGCPSCGAGSPGLPSKRRPRGHRSASRDAAVPPGAWRAPWPAGGTTSCSRLVPSPPRARFSPVAHLCHRQVGTGLLVTRGEHAVLGH